MNAALIALALTLGQPSLGGTGIIGAPLVSVGETYVITRGQARPLPRVWIVTLTGEPRLPVEQTP